MTAFRTGLLAGRTVALAGCHGAVRDGLLELGARLQPLDPAADLETDEEHVGEWARARAPLHAIVYDASCAFGGGGQAGLRASSAQAWVAIREVTGGVMIPREEGGKVVVIAPSPEAGPFAEAARAALESLARTLSVEWARYRITATMIAPGACTTGAEVAALVCFLISRGGDYLSGCRFSLSGGRARG
jgi:NAD(P)-dependent dehydrogenase (short-subunit alcohol dehydrogenase family)